MKKEIFLFSLFTLIFHTYSMELVRRAHGEPAPAPVDMQSIARQDNG